MKVLGTQLLPTAALSQPSSMLLLLSSTQPDLHIQYGGHNTSCLCADEAWQQVQHAGWPCSEQSQPKWQLGLLSGHMSILIDWPRCTQHATLSTESFAMPCTWTTLTIFNQAVAASPHRLTLPLLLCCSPAASFVTRSGNQLLLDGEPFYHMGFNAVW